MNRKLLYKTQKTYLIYSVVTFLIISPVFYFVTEKLSLDDADETLRLNKKRFVNQILPDFKINDIKTWNYYNPNNQILEDRSIPKDSIFSMIAYSELEQENEPFRVIYSTIQIDQNPFLYTERIDLVESEDLLISIAILFAVLTILLICGFLIITHIMSKRIWQPFYQLINQIENFEIDKKAIPNLAISTIEEFNRLNKSIKKLINRNIEIYKTQREFIDNASHELQTPLAIFRSKLDILIQREDITEGQAKIIESVDQTVDKLIKLNKNLLILSKIDRHNQFEVESVSLKSVIEKQVIFFNKNSNSTNLSITLKVFNDISVKTNKNLLESLINNLLLNALQHNIEKGIVVIELKDNEVVISNSSENSKLPEEKMFNRFEKSHASKQGNGLGLAIVKKIADINNWIISYSYSKNIHTFRVQF